jgi:hypothetical protein
MATEKLKVYKLPISGQTTEERVQVGDRAASLGSIKLAIICGIKEPFPEE